MHLLSGEGGQRLKRGNLMSLRLMLLLSIPQFSKWPATVLLSFFLDCRLLVSQSTWVQFGAIDTLGPTIRSICSTPYLIPQLCSIIHQSHHMSVVSSPPSRTKSSPSWPPAPLPSHLRHHQSCSLSHRRSALLTINTSFKALPTPFYASSPPA